jgi:hypothetical protein
LRIESRIAHGRASIVRAGITGRPASRPRLVAQSGPRRPGPDPAMSYLDDPRVLFAAERTLLAVYVASDG